MRLNGGLSTFAAELGADAAKEAWMKANDEAPV
jgi:hypothetical protein